MPVVDKASVMQMAAKTKTHSCSQRSVRPVMETDKLTITEQCAEPSRSQHRRPREGRLPQTRRILKGFHKEMIPKEQSLGYLGGSVR